MKNKKRDKTNCSNFEFRGAKHRILLMCSFLFVVLFSTTVSAARLPIVNGDDNNWGTILNNYLQTLSDANATSIRVGNITANGNISFFNASGDEKLRILSNGNIGIGTVAPSEKIHLQNGTLLIDNPSSPSLVGSLDTGSSDLYGRAYALYVSGKYAYVADEYEGLKIVDISNPSSPSLVGSLDTDRAWGVHVSGKYAYVADGASGLRIIDISDPSSPVLTATLDTTLAHKVYVSGKYAYVADYQKGLKIFDIKGADIHALSAGNINTNDITVWENVDIGNNLYVRNGLNVGPGGIYSGGELSVYTSATKPSLSVTKSSDASATDPLASFFKGTSEVVRIDSSGSVGIGTTSPNSKLEVSGNLTVNSSSNMAFQVYNSSGSSLFYVNGSNGNIGIGTTNPTHELNIIGEVNISTSSAQGLYIGDGSKQTNITLYSPDGTEWACGVNDAGTFSCS